MGQTWYSGCWIDCDTGVDDAVALLCTMKLSSLQLLGVSAVSGNVVLEHTFPNTRNILSLAGHPEIRAYAGAAQPLQIALEDASYIHGKNGLDGVILPDSPAPVETESAIDAIYDAAVRTNGNMELVTIGPLTNIAMVLRKYPDFPKHVRRIVMMGGAAAHGNATPYSEFNIHADPHAADIVYSSGIPIVMFGLDVTWKAYMTKEEYEQISAVDTPVCQLFARTMKLSLAINTEQTGKGLCIHDACPILYLDDPSLFQGKQCGIHVITEKGTYFGKTTCDLYEEKPYDMRNVTIMLETHRGRLIQRISDLLRSY